MSGEVYVGRPDEPEGQRILNEDEYAVHRAVQLIRIALQKGEVRIEFIKEELKKVGL